MTFIASVVATDGIAIVSDSFVTTSTYSIEVEDLIEFLKAKSPSKPLKNVQLQDVFKLMKLKPGHTRNYAEKLFEFDKYTAITFAGHAAIYVKPLKEILNQLRAEWVLKDAHELLPIDNLIDYLKDSLINEIKTQLSAPNCNVGHTVFLISRWDVNNSKARIFKLSINRVNSDQFNKTPDMELVSSQDNSTFPIVTDGQDDLIDRFLYGSLYRYKKSIIETITEKICTKTKLKKATKDKAYQIIVDDDHEPINKMLQHDINLVSLRQLSLQEAVDLAALLLRITMDLQVYTEKIPTVGGLIRIAVIRKDTGFQYISGNELEKPKLVY